MLCWRATLSQVSAGVPGGPDAPPTGRGVDSGGRKPTGKGGDGGRSFGMLVLTQFNRFIAKAGTYRWPCRACSGNTVSLVRATILHREVFNLNVFRMDPEPRRTQPCRRSAPDGGVLNAAAVAGLTWACIVIAH